MTDRYPRLPVMAGVIGALAVLLGARLVWLGTVAADEIAPPPPELEVRAQRGSIWDRDGAVLATESYRYRVAVAPNEVADPDALATAVAPVIGRTVDEVRAAATDSRRWVVLARDVTPAGAAALEAAKLRGLHLESVPRRSYPLGTAAGHLTGFVNAEGDAFYGIEAHYDRLLRGRPGSLAGNLGTDPTAFRRAQPGVDLVLTVDRELQQAARDVLARVVDEENAVGGSIVVLEPASGALLASVSLPGYDPNRYASADPRTYADPVVSHQYEPGSVIKAITMAAALDAGVVGVDSTYEDTGFIEVEGIRIANWDRLAHGETSMTRLLQHSLNVGAVHLAQGLGTERFYSALRAFGFGAPTGVDLTGEIGGDVHDPRAADWYAGNLAVNSFGQGMASTPLQVAAAMAAIANEGRLMVPYVVRTMVQPDGQTLATSPQLARQVIAPATARATRRMLEAVVTGRVTQAAVPGYSVGGKTGSSQIPVAGGYHPTDTIASFAGFLPVEQPRVVILVKVDRPDTPRGSDVAAPAFREVAEAAIELLDIPPDQPAKRPAPLEVTP